MIDLSQLLPKLEAFEIYNNIEFMDELTDDELRLVLQSVYFYSDEMFAEDICRRWTQDKMTGEQVKSAPFHSELWKQEAKREDSLYIVARDHAKTTAVSKIRTLKELLYGLEKSILFIMTKSLGEAVVGDIRKELESNDDIRFVFGQLVPNENRANFKTEKWRQRELQLLNGNELKTITKGEAVRGQRPTKIRVDDPQEKKDVKNPEMAQEFWDWFWTAVYPTLDDNGSVTVLATMISKNCFANQLKQEAVERKFKVIEYPAILNFNEEDFSGTPLWPEKWPMHALKKRYEKLTRKPFLQEYQNIPFASVGVPVFDTGYTYEVLEPIEEDYSGDLKIYRPLEGQNIFLGMDFAKGKVGGDYQAMIGRNEKRELLCEYRGLLPQDLLPNVVDKIAAKAKTIKVIPENNYALTFLVAAQTHSWFRSIYREVTMDKVTKKQSESLGMNTNAKTKPMLINALDVVLRGGTHEVSAKEKEELENYYYNESGGMEAVKPYHDDTVIADAMCEQGVKRGISGPALLII